MTLGCVDLHAFARQTGFVKRPSTEVYSCRASSELRRKMETIALKNDVERLRRELQPAQCTALNEEGFTLLFFACMKKCVKLETIRTIAQVAQKAPSSVDAKTADGETPLYASVFNNRVDVVELLLSLGADVQAINGTRKETALHAAARLGYVEMTTLLLKSGANVNALNARRETPLFSAARAGHHDTVYVLLERAEGVNRTLANEDGKDPLYIASERGHKPVVLLLKAERSHLRHAKAEADVEYRQRLAAGPAVMSSEAMMDRAAADTTYAQMVSSHHVEAQQQKSGAGTSRGAKIDVIPIVAPKPKARTHDPFTGATLGPCRTLEEVGYDAPPPIPRELQGRPPVKPARVGGTSLVVGTGTEEGGRAPIRVESVLLGSDVYEYGVIAPTMHGR